MTNVNWVDAAGLACDKELAGSWLADEEAQLAFAWEAWWCSLFAVHYIDHGTPHRPPLGQIQGLLLPRSFRINHQLHGFIVLEHIQYEAEALREGRAGQGKPSPAVQGCPGMSRALQGGS